MEKIKIMICGSGGAMGKMLASCIAQSDNLEVVCGFDTKPNTSDTFETYTSLNDVGEQIDCVIDFSHYTASSAITAFCVAKNLPLVSATTGLDAQAEETIREASQKIPVFRSKNFSYGINVLIKLSVQAAKLLGDFDAEIIEAHHNKKADAPSGTAQMLAEAVMAAEADGAVSFTADTAATAKGKKTKSPCIRCAAALFPANMKSCLREKTKSFGFRTVR
jgi:4-hydroxy-tetrahydrodipicolinate reductase